MPFQGATFKASCSNNNWNSSGPTWWPQSSARSAPAVPASQTDRGRVPPRPGTTLESEPWRGAAPWSPTHTASCVGRSRGGSENWSFPLSLSDLLHSLRIAQYKLQCRTKWRFCPYLHLHLSRASDGGILAGCGAAVLSGWMLFPGIVGKALGAPPPAPWRSGGRVDRNCSSTSWPFISASSSSTKNKTMRDKSTAQLEIRIN